jgi:hypothetical protein
MKPNVVELNFQRQVQMGLGEAILRLVHVELKYANGVFDLPDHLKQEREMIVEALNQYELNLGFDCNTDKTDTVPDTVAIFERAAVTSCCRIFHKDTSRRQPTPPIGMTFPSIDMAKPLPNLERLQTAPPVVAAVEPPLIVVDAPSSIEAPRRRDNSRRR